MIVMVPDKSLYICSSKKPITKFAWSMDDSILAIADADNAVSIVNREEVSYNKKNVNPDFKPVEIHGKGLSIFKSIEEINITTKNYYVDGESTKYYWNFIGRYQSHWREIISKF